MSFFLNKVLNIGDYVLLMKVRAPMTAGLPLFYREVLSAQAEFLEHLHYAPRSVSTIKNLPIFLNKYIKNDDKLLYCKDMVQAKLVQLKDIMYEVLPGFLPAQAICDSVQEVNQDVNFTTVSNYYRVIRDSVPRSWRLAIEANIEHSESGGFPALKFAHGADMKEFSVIRCKQIYERFVVKAAQKPASLPFWRRMFPMLDENKIWDKWKIKGNSIEADDHDFKLRHNKIFTNVILHQLDRRVVRECDVCGLVTEDLMHMYIKCPKLCGFFKMLKCCLTKKLNFVWSDRDSWEVFVLFGVWDMSMVISSELCRFLLSHARWAIKSRRNIAHFENKLVPVWPIFKSMVQTQVKYTMVCGSTSLKTLFLRDNCLVSCQQGGKLIWRW